MGFDDWLEEYREGKNRIDADWYPSNVQIFKAGQQSKQEEIDALKAKIEDITKWAELHIKDYNRSEIASEHDRGWFNAACQVLMKLKGD